MSETLFYGGLAALGAVAALSAAAAVFFRLAASKLNRCFDGEYGKRKG